MKRKFFYVMLLTITIFGCDDVVETNIIAIEEEVYVLSFISPEIDTLAVNVSRTLPALGLELSLDSPQTDIERFIIANAEVTIENSEGNAIRLPFLEDQLLYAESTENFDIAPGETYTLTVIIDDENYTSQCTVPFSNILGIQEEIRIQEDEFNFEEYTLDLSFADIPNTDNFYFIGGFLDPEGQDEFQFQNNLFFDLEAFKTDNIGDGGLITANVSFFPFFSFDSPEPQLADQDLVLQVINAEQPLFEILRSDYLNDINEDNPFIELGVFPNNITGRGGTGLFAAYRYFEKRIPLE